MELPLPHHHKNTLPREALLAACRRLPAGQVQWVDGWPYVPGVGSISTTTDLVAVHYAGIQVVFWRVFVGCYQEAFILGVSDAGVTLTLDDFCVDLFALAREHADRAWDAAC